MPRMSNTSSISSTRRSRSPADNERSCLSGRAMFSATESVGYMTGYWKTMPMLRVAVGSAVTSRSPNRIRPEVGRSRPAIMRINVVLPQPDGPSRQVTSASAKRMSMFSTAVKWPNCFVTRSTVMVAMEWETFCDLSRVSPSLPDRCPAKPDATLSNRRRSSSFTARRTEARDAEARRLETQDAAGSRHTPVAGRSRVEHASSCRAAKAPWRVTTSGARRRRRRAGSPRVRS